MGLYITSEGKWHVLRLLKEYPKVLHLKQYMQVSHMQHSVCCTGILHYKWCLEFSRKRNALHHIFSACVYVLVWHLLLQIVGFAAKLKSMYVQLPWNTNLVMWAMSFKMLLDWHYLTSKIWHYGLVSKPGNMPPIAWSFWIYIPSVSEYLNSTVLVRMH